MSKSLRCASPPPSAVCGQTKVANVSGNEDVLLLHHYLADLTRFYAVVVDDDDEEVLEPEAEFVWIAVPVAVRVLVPVRVFPRVKVLEPPPAPPPPRVPNIGGYPVGEPVKLSMPVREGKADPLSDESGIVIV